MKNTSKPTGTEPTTPSTQPSHMKWPGATPIPPVDESTLTPEDLDLRKMARAEAIRLKEALKRELELRKIAAEKPLSRTRRCRRRLALES